MSKASFWVPTGIALAVCIMGLTLWIKHDDWITFPDSRAPLSALMKDPSSTQFRKEFISKSGWLCGEFNSKNEYGAYVGFKKFISNKVSGAVYVEGLSLISAPTVDETAALLKKENAFWDLQMLSAKTGGHFEKYSDRERNQMARIEQFEEQWNNLCVNEK